MSLAMILATSISLLAGLVFAVFGVAKGVRDLRYGHLAFTEARFLLGGLLLAGSTVAARIWDTTLAGIESLAGALSAAGDAESLCWWAIAIGCWVLAVSVMPGPRAIAEEYAMERHGLAGMLVTRGRTGR